MSMLVVPVLPIVGMLGEGKYVPLVVVRPYAVTGTPKLRIMYIGGHEQPKERYNSARDWSLAVFKEWSEDGHINVGAMQLGMTLDQQSGFLRFFDSKTTDYYPVKIENFAWRDEESVGLVATGTNGDKVEVIKGENPGDVCIKINGVVRIRMGDLSKDPCNKATTEDPLQYAIDAYPAYWRRLPENWVAIDTYRVDTLFPLNDSRLTHARKKLLVPGVRTGGKSMRKDIKEAYETIGQWLKDNPDE
jgi:hypothetical protein